MEVDFSLASRPRILERLKEETFDVLIIGGGITGAGIALDASARGLRTALLEKNDFAFGTSSRSTKLIHGGLRYLKQLEFGLVKEVGSERAVVHKLAPHLVLPEKMLLPLYEKRGFGSLLTSLGLKLYDWLASVSPEDQRRMLTRRQTLKAEPLLNPHDIKGGALYAEYRTDDARLTIELIKKGFKQGAKSINYVAVTDFIYQDNAIAGVRAVDQETGEPLEIKATVVVNATGPWVDEIREINKSKEGKTLHLTKGVHIVVAHEKLPVRQSIYFDVGDGRMIFAIPRGSKTYIGTTDTNYQGSKEEVFADKNDVDYLVNAVNNTFQGTSLTSADIESTWAGLRPLIHEEGKSASELSRKDEIFLSDTGLISIAGGKLTGYRKMAERVVDLVIDRAFAAKKWKACSTQSILLTEEPFKNASEVSNYIGKLRNVLTARGGDANLAAYLVNNYGKKAGKLIDSASGSGRQFEEALVRAEVLLTLNEEMAVRPLDFLVRRSGMLLFNTYRMKTYLEVVLDQFSNWKNWTQEERRKEKNEVEEYIRASAQF